jgi:hypothetical protein
MKTNAQPPVARNLGIHAYENSKLGYISLPQWTARPAENLAVSIYLPQ